ncbi:MAG: hypothetical protein M0032_05090 [Actinomycetota bacterium]|nr:hypothetical protein [Actinomycetota bacterium]
MGAGEARGDDRVSQVETAGHDPSVRDRAGRDPPGPRWPPAPSCLSCDGPVRPGSLRCYCCDRLVRTLGRPLAPVATACAYRVGEQAHRWLRAYKDDPSPAVRTVTARVLAERFDAWLRWAGDDLAVRFGGPWEAVATVPSTRPGRHGAPVDVLVRSVPSLAGATRVPLVRASAPVGHLVADARAFAVAGGLRPDGPVLVVDDTVTTGARAQSAVACLRLAGWRVAGVVAVGRALDPTVGPWVATYWAERRGWQVPALLARDPRAVAPGRLDG